MSLKPSPAQSGCWQNNFKSIPVTPGEGNCAPSGSKNPLENSLKQVWSQVEGRQPGDPAWNHPENLRVDFGEPVSGP